jgi:frataxin-like iron-binding protein CyaY
MHISKDSRGIRFRFTQHEWKRKYKQCRALIDEIKITIPSEERRFDEETKEWWISRENIALFEKLEEKHMKDPNQMDMFAPPGPESPV